MDNQPEKYSILCKLVPSDYVNFYCIEPRNTIGSLHTHNFKQGLEPANQPAKHCICSDIAKFVNSALSGF